MEMTREHIGFTLDLRDMLLLCLQTDFVRAAVACAVLERTSGNEPLYETNNCSKIFELFIVPSFRPFTLISLWMPMVLDRLQYGL